MNTSGGVTHCVCADTELVSLRGYPSMEAVKEETTCGTFCGLCVPYIEELLDKGRSES